MLLSRLFSRLYHVLEAQRALLLAATAAVLALAALAARTIELRQDVAALLPDDESTLAQDFRLLQEAPFARKVVVHLTAAPGVAPPALIDAVDRLAAELRPPLFRRVDTGFTAPPGPLFGWLLAALPGLSMPADLAALEAELGPEGVRGHLREGFAQLLSPEGWALKGLVRIDPLGFRSIALAKLRHLSLIPRMNQQGGHFVSADGRHALLIADTPVPMTDSGGAARLLDQLDRAIARALPRGVTAAVVSGHRYTLANARAIQGDLTVVLTLSSLAVLGIYVAFLRSRWALFVFLVPASVLLLASGALPLLYGEVFAATLGFGAVLLGIADEYAMHIYFALRKGRGEPGAIVGEVSRPVLFSGLVTLASFGVMLHSSLPGQRQLAVYSMIGIAASLLISLVVLPHLIPPAPQMPEPKAAPLPRAPLPRAWVLAGWVALLALAGWQTVNVRFNGDMRALSLVPPDLRAAERDLQQAWGDLRGKALVFAEGRSQEEALRSNDRLFAYLRDRVPPGELVSLAPLVPSEATQRENRARWSGFWDAGRRDVLRQSLAAEGAALGFSAGAFEPFLVGLEAPPRPVTLEGLAAAGLGEVVGSLVLRSGGSVRVLTLVPDTPAVVALFDAPTCPPGVHLVSQTRFGAEIGRAIGRDFTWYLAVTLVLVVTLVVLVFRETRKSLLALVPVVTGLVAMFGAMGLLDIEFNLFNIVATILIIGLCVDYGIYMVCKVSEGSEHAGDRAVLVSGLTTLAGFGALVLARHPAMHSIGVTVLFGIGAAIPAALVVIPALWELTASCPPARDRS